jgi:acyl-CoA synthetase (NDP forming)
MRDMGRSNLVAIHPSASEIEGVAAYPSLGAVPHKIDYVMATVPARSCAELIAGAGRAEFVHVISGGFREAGADGEALEQQLVTAAREAKVRVLGPNCMGVFSPRGRLTFQLDAPKAIGTVSVVSQSGGLAADLIKVGDARGVRFSKLVSIGNAVDVTHAELLDWLIDDPDTDVVGLYIEDPRDGNGLVRALRRASGRVPVVALVGGLSAQGGRAVASHTGALAADERIWQGISRATGVTVVSSFEELVGSLRFLQRYAGVSPATGPNVLIAGVGGGATVLAADACDRAGLAIDLLTPNAKKVLSERGYGVGTSIVNPIEIPIGPAVAPDVLATVLGLVLAEQPFSDVLVHLHRGDGRSNLRWRPSRPGGAQQRVRPRRSAQGGRGGVRCQRPRHLPDHV